MSSDTKFEDVAYFWRSFCTLFLLSRQMRVTVGHSGLCCVSVTSFERWLTPLFVDSKRNQFETDHQITDHLETEEKTNTDSQYFVHIEMGRKRCGGIIVLWCFVLCFFVVSAGLNKFYSYFVIINSTNKYRKHKSSMVIWVLRTDKMW